jgi:hypothetical protein
MREPGESSDFGKHFKTTLPNRENKSWRPVQTDLPKGFQKVIDPWNDNSFVNSGSAGVRHICVNFEYRNKIKTERAIERYQWV